MNSKYKKDQKYNSMQILFKSSVVRVNILQKTYQG